MDLLRPSGNRYNLRRDLNLKEWNMNKETGIETGWIFRSTSRIVEWSFNYLKCEKIAGVYLNLK